MKLKPINNILIVDPIEESDTTAGGIFIGNNVDRDAPKKGRVLAKGPGAPDGKGGRQPMATSVGDVVLYPAHVWVPVEIDGEDLGYVHDDHCLAIIEEDA